MIPSMRQQCRFPNIISGDEGAFTRDRERALLRRWRSLRGPKLPC